MSLSPHLQRHAQVDPYNLHILDGSGVRGNFPGEDRIIIPGAP